MHQGFFGAALWHGLSSLQALASSSRSFHWLALQASKLCRKYSAFTLLLQAGLWLCFASTVSAGKAEVTLVSIRVMQRVLDLFERPVFLCCVMAPHDALVWCRGFKTVQDVISCSLED